MTCTIILYLPYKHSSQRTREIYKVQGTNYLRNKLPAIKYLTRAGYKRFRMLLPVGYYLADKKCDLNNQQKKTFSLYK